MSKNNDHKIKDYRNKVLFSFFIALFAFFGDLVINNVLIVIIMFFIYLAGFIVSLVFSIKLINLKDYGFGISFTVLSSLFLFFLFLIFLAAFIVGVNLALLEPTMTANVLSVF